MSVFTDIETGLHTRLATLAGSPVISWPNMKFIPTNGISYIQPTILPTTTTLHTVAGGEEHSGIYQVSIYEPLEKGVASLLSVIDSVDTIFRSSKTISSGSNKIFILAVSRGIVNRQDSWFVGVLEVHYICYS